MKLFVIALIVSGTFLEKAEGRLVHSPPPALGDFESGFLAKEAYEEFADMFCFIDEFPTQKKTDDLLSKTETEDPRQLAGLPFLIGIGALVTGIVGGLRSCEEKPKYRKIWVPDTLCGGGHYRYERIGLNNPAGEEGYEKAPHLFFAAVDLTRPFASDGFGHIQTETPLMLAVDYDTCVKCCIKEGGSSSQCHRVCLE